MAAPWRPNLYVVARFLDALHEGPRSRSDLQAAAGVNYDIFRRYLAFLGERGYVALGDQTVTLTAAGLRVRTELRAWLAEFLQGPGPEADWVKSLHERSARDADQ